MTKARARHVPAQTNHRVWMTLLATALVVGTAFVTVYVGLQRDPQPHQVPVAVTGSTLAHALRDGLGNRVAVQEVTSRAQGSRLVRDGDVVAGVTATSSGDLVADVAGAQGLSETAATERLLASFATAAHLELRTSDVVPLVSYDSRGLVSFYVVFGVTLSSFILAQSLTGNAARVRLKHRVWVLTVFAVLIGTIAAVLSGPVLGAVAAPVVPLAGTLILLSAASSFGTKALVSWLGPIGIGVAVLTLTVAGNATSGATIGVDLLPAWARFLSNVLPQGAAFRIVKDLGYFHGANAAGSLVVLLAWALIGFFLVVAHDFLKRRSAARAHHQARPAHAMQQAA